MSENGDKKSSGTATIEMQPVSLDDKDNASPSIAESPRNTDSSAASERPPKPPKRDYTSEKAEAQQINNVSYAAVNKRKKVISFPTRPEFIPRPDYSDTSMSCLPNVLVVFNLFIWILGATITALGVWIKIDKEFWEIRTNLDLTQFTSASYILIITGVIIMLIGFIGCYGACFSKIWMLVIFSIIVVIVIVMEIAIIAIVWSAVSNKNVQEDIKLKATNSLHEMLTDGKKVFFINLMQSKLGCCGVSGHEDYSSIDKVNPYKIPDSCISTETGKPYETGCYDAVLNFLKSKAAIVGGVAVVIILLQLMVLVLSTCLICGLKNTVSNVIF